jgi:hypothetical protein
VDREIEHFNMKILAIEKEVAGITDGQCQPYLEAEATRVWELYQSGVFRELYFRSDRSEAVLMLESGSVAEAIAILRTLPLVKEGLIDFELMPLRPYPGFKRLFSSVAKAAP